MYLEMALVVFAALLPGMLGGRLMALMMVSALWLAWRNKAAVAALAAYAGWWL